MNDKDLRKLSRAELIELLLEQSNENKQLRSRNRYLEKELQNRLIAIEECGTMSEAALLLNNLFYDADRACKQYIENIKHRAEQAAAEDKNGGQK